MAQIQETDFSHGRLFSVQEQDDDIEEHIEASPDPARLRELGSEDDPLQELLQLGREWLGAEHGYLTRIDIANGRHTIVEGSESHPAVPPGETRDLSTTYCRRILSENAILAVQNAPEEGWREDPAYEAFGFSTYLGAKVVMNGTFYGTLCFADRAARDAPFTEEDAATVHLLARTAGQLLKDRQQEHPQSQPTKAQLEALFEHSPNMINLHDEEGNLIAPNPHLCEKTGYRADELTGMKVWELDRDATPDKVRALWSDMAPGAHHRWEGTFQCKDGSTFPVEVDLRCIDVEGETRFIVNSRDITARREAERTRRQSEELHRETLRNISDAVFITREDGTFTYVCPNAEHIFKRTPKEVEELETISALLGSDPAQPREFGTAQEMSNVEHRVVDAEGTEHDLLINIRRVHIQDGRRMYTCRDVTERKAAERELRETKRLLETTLESLAEAVVVVDPAERQILTCNAAVEEIFGYEKEELIGESTKKLHKSPEAHERFGVISEASLEADGIFRGEYQMRRKDGDIIDTEHVVTPLQDENWPDGVVSIIRDITERKRHEQELENMRERIELTLENTDSLIFEIDFATDEVRRHGNFADFFDLPSDDVPTWKDHLDHAVHPNDRPAFRKFYSQLAEGKRDSGDFEYRTNPELGNVRWIRDHVYVEKNGSRRLLGLAQDITEQKETAQQLQEERDLLNRILETSPVAIAVLNTEGEFVEASGRAEDILGLERDEVTSRTYNDPAWRLRGPNGGPISDDELPFARVMATEEPVYDIEHMIEWPDGTQRLLSVSGAPLHDANGELEGAVFHLNDITEQRAARKALQEERDRFATLFHNFPTPVVHGRPDDDGRLRIQAVNERFESVFGYDEPDIRGEDLQDLIVPDDEKEDAASLRRRLLDGEPIQQEVRRRAADGLRDFRLQVALRDAPDGPSDGFAIYTDVTERNEREEALARRKALLEAQAETTIDGLLVVDADRKVSFFNDRFLEIWDISQAVLDSSQSGSLCEETFLEAVHDQLPDPVAFRQEIEYLHDHPEKESRDVIRLTDGRWIDRYSAPIVDDDGFHLGRLWIFRDVTEQRNMMERLLEVQEEERRRIDQEIHDDMGGLLTSLQFTVGLARRSDPEEWTEHLDQLETLISDLSTISRTISRKLYPNNLSANGLTDALHSLVDKMEQDHDLTVDLYVEVTSSDRFSVLIERTVFWIVQEALLHIARESDVDTTQVLLSKRGKRLYLHVFDEGTGFTAPSMDTETSFQEAIRRRTEWLDGELRLDPMSDDNTQISITLPVRPPFPTP